MASHNANPELRAAVLRELANGGSRADIARRLGITKNAVQGHIARAGLCVPFSEPPTMEDRLRALADKMDRVLAETLPILQRDRENWRESEAKILAAKLKAKRDRNWAA